MCKQFEDDSETRKFRKINDKISLLPEKVYTLGPQKWGRK